MNKQMHIMYLIIGCLSFVPLQAMEVEREPYVTHKELMYDYGLSRKEIMALGGTIIDATLKKLHDAHGKRIATELDEHVKNGVFPKDMRTYIIHSHFEHFDKAHATSYTSEKVNINHYSTNSFCDHLKFLLSKRLAIHPKKSDLLYVATDSHLQKWKKEENNWKITNDLYIPNIRCMTVDPETGYVYVGFDKVYSANTPLPIQIWDIEHKKHIGTLVLKTNVENEKIVALTILATDSAKKLYAGSCGTLHKWNWDKENNNFNEIYETYLWGNRTSLLVSLTYDSKKKYLYSTENYNTYNTNFDSEIIAWDTIQEKWAATRQLTGYRKYVDCLAMHPNNNHLYVGTNEKTIQVHDPYDSTTYMHKLENNIKGNISDIVIHHLTDYMYSLDCNGTILEWKPAFDYNDITFSQWYNLERDKKKLADLH